MQGNCLAYGEGITFWPMLRVVHDACGIEDDDAGDVARERIAAVIGDLPDVRVRVESIAGLIDTPFAVAELVWAMRCFLERLAEQAPFVVVFDDVHWAEQTFLDAVAELADQVRGPVLFLCTARPSVLEDHRRFVEGGPSVVLAPLDDEQCERFLRMVLGGSGVDAQVIRRLVAAADGNPLFIEQLLSMLIDEGRLADVEGHWRVKGDLATLEVPASIEALLAARLDRLPPEERRVLEPASVIGRRFSQDAVTHLVDDSIRDNVGVLLVDLADRDLVAPLDEEEPAFRFQHQLIRDATYRGILKQLRAILHERFVEWGDTVNAARDRATEFEEIQGYNLEQAYRYWREIGPLDERVVGLGVDASRRLVSAGERAYARGDMRAAANLLGRAADLLPESHAERPRALLLAANALHETGAFDKAIATYDASARAADAAGLAGAALAGLIEGLRLQYLIGRVDDTAAVEAEVHRVLDRLGEIDDPDALSRAWQLRLNLDIAACRWASAQNAATEVIEHARRAGNSVLEVRTMPLLAFLAQKGPMPVGQATAACRDILQRVVSDRRSSGVAQLEFAMLSAMALDVDQARDLYRDTRRVLEELGWEMRAALVSLSSGPIELLVDEPARAEAELRRDYDSLLRLEERNFISLTAVLLAEAVYRQHRFDEAAHLIEFSREVTAPDDLAVQILLRCVDGKLAARAKDCERGVALVTEAVAMIETTDDPSGQGNAYLDLVETLVLAGRQADAEAAVDTARERYVQKGNVAGVRRAERIAMLVRHGRDPLD